MSLFVILNRFFHCSSGNINFIGLLVVGCHQAVYPVFTYLYLRVRQAPVLTSIIELVYSVLRHVLAEYIRHAELEYPFAVTHGKVNQLFPCKITFQSYLATLHRLFFFSGCDLFFQFFFFYIAGGRFVKVKIAFYPGGMYNARIAFKGGGGNFHCSIRNHCTSFGCFCRAEYHRLAVKQNSGHAFYQCIRPIGMSGYITNHRDRLFINGCRYGRTLYDTAGTGACTESD